MSDRREHGRNFDKSSHQRSVEHFMRKAGQDVPDKPTIPSEEVRLLRAKLILEEALETIQKGLGVVVFLDTCACENGDIDFNHVEFIPDGKPNLVEIADGCADIAVVTTGTLSACGLIDIPIQEEVNRHNLAKFGPGGYRREDGKWIKPPDLKPPRIAELIEEEDK